jgi:hypothetical protein
VLDSLWEILDEYQAKVYMRLIRLSRGYKRDTCRVGYDRLATSCKLSKRKVQDVISQLLAMGLLEKLGTAYGGEKGTTYRVIVPGETVAPDATVARRATVAQQDTVAPPATMKDLEKKHENAVYEIRTIAARLFEAHRSDPGFDQQRLRQLVIDALIGQGTQPNADAVDEAIRGMAT